jgi:hypothetical protein
MKLSTARLQQTLDQLENAGEFEGTVAIPDDNPAIAKLNQVFGDHTFLLDSEGLHIVEPLAPESDEAAECQVVKLASWADANCTTLAPHRPEPTDIVVVLAPDEA